MTSPTDNGLSRRDILKISAATAIASAAIIDRATPVLADGELSLKGKRIGISATGTDHYFDLQAYNAQIAEVKRIHNELTVGPASYYAERTSDGVISTRIRTRLTVQEGFPASRAKIFTVGGTVYLMGKLTQAEADLAVGLIKEVPGVKRIIKLVDYLPAAPAAAPAATPAAG